MPLELRLYPVMFESGAHPYPPRDWYVENMAQSDIYVGVFDRSYGEIVPALDISGIEDEFNLSAPKQRLVYVSNARNREARLTRMLARIRADATITYTRFTDTP